MTKTPTPVLMENAHEAILDWRKDRSVTDTQVDDLIQYIYRLEAELHRAKTG